MLTYLRLSTEFAQDFAVISMPLAPVPYTELLKSVGLQELVYGFS